MPDLSFIKIYDDLLDSNSCQSVIRSFNKLNDADHTPFMYRTETKGKTSIDFVRFSFAASQDNIQKALDKISKMLK